MTYVRIEDQGSGAIRSSGSTGVAEREFLASLNYEVRTPLTAILGLLELLLETPLDEVQREYVQLAYSSARSLLEILNITLELAALARGELKLEEAPTNLKELLETTFPVASSNGKQVGDIEIEIGSQLPPIVVTDPVRIQQIFELLIRAVRNVAPEAKFSVRANAEAIDFGRALLKIDFMVDRSSVKASRSQLRELKSCLIDAYARIARAKPGLGPGLTLAVRLAKHMGGEVGLLEDDRFFGLTLRLPVRVGGFTAD